MKYIVLTFLIITCVASNSVAQDQYDWRSWTSVELVKKLPFGLSIGLENQMRLDRFSTEFDRYQAQLNLGYSWKKKVELEYGFRAYTSLDNQGKNQGWEQYVRHQLSTSFKHKADRFSFAYRYRYQWRNQLGITQLEGDYPSKDHRIRVKGGYNIRDWKWDPWISWEGFFHQERGAYSGYDRFRIVTGTEHKFKDYGTLQLRLAYQQDSRVWNPSIDFITMIGWVYKL